MPQSCLLVVEKRPAEVSHGTDSNADYEGFLIWADIKRKAVLKIVPTLLFHQASLSFVLNNLENVVYSALQGMNCFPGDSGHLCLSLKLSHLLVYSIC